MELKYKIGLSIWFLILFSLFSLAVTQKIFVETNFRGNNVLNISNLTGVAFLNITLGYVGVSQIATLSDLVAGNITVTSVIEVKNDNAITFNAGDAVYFTSYISGLSLQGVKFANNTDASKHSDCIILDTIVANARGQCVVEGDVTGMDTSGFSFGDELYLDTGGNLTSTKPTDANCIQRIAQVRRSHASLGVIWVSGAGRCNDVPARFSVPGDINTSASFYQGGNKVNDSLLNLGQFNNDVGFYSTIGDLPTAAVTDGATTTISTGDQIYDFTIALNYITNAVSDLINYFTKSQIFGHFDKNITSANASIVSYIDAKNVSDFIDRRVGWTNLTKYPTACTAGSYITTLGDSVTCVTADTSAADDWNLGNSTAQGYLTVVPDRYAVTDGSNVTGNWNHTIGNYTFAENGTICFGWSCQGRIYYNGSSLVIKVT